ncbi:MAG: hypothetical protein PUD93_11235 [Lachnospiraceae bacterium]|nr:hypothetical protein [Lachnospiraceae bacterium]
MKKQISRIKQINRIKQAASVFLILALSFSLISCGKKEDGKSVTIEGELTDLMAEIYAGIDIDAETKEAMQGYISEEINAENEEYILGTTGIPYKEGICSVPMISSIAYQCVLLRVEPENVDTVKKTLQETADVNKWVCVSAETVLVESRGDLVLFAMCREDVAYALSSAFQSLK